jgi:hypothetical protein
VTPRKKTRWQRCNEETNASCQRHNIRLCRTAGDVLAMGSCVGLLLFSCSFSKKYIAEGDGNEWWEKGGAKIFRRISTEKLWTRYNVVSHLVRTYFPAGRRAERAETHVREVRPTSKLLLFFCNFLSFSFGVPTEGNFLKQSSSGATEYNILA